MLGANVVERLAYRLVPFDAVDLSRAEFAQVAAEARAGGLWWVLTFREVLGEYGWLVPLAVLAAWPVVWTVWAFLTRGGLSLSLTGLALVRTDGRPAPRWRCALRAVLVWTPVVVPLALCVWVKLYAPERYLLHSGLWLLAEAVLVAEVILAIHRPQQAPHDRLLGTCLVPL